MNLRLLHVVRGRFLSDFSAQRGSTLATCLREIDLYVLPPKGRWKGWGNKDSDSPPRRVS